MISPLNIEEELLALLKNYSSEEIQFSNVNEVFKIKALDLIETNNENDIISYIENELYKSEIIRKYLDDKIQFSFNEFLNQQIIIIKDDLTFVENCSIELNDKIEKNNLKIKEKSSSYDWEYHKYGILQDREELNETLTNVNTVKNSHLLQLEKFQQFLIENIELSNYDVNATKKSLTIISKILFRNELKYRLYFNSIEIEKRYYNFNEIDKSNYNRTFKEISIAFSNNLKMNPNIIPINWKKIFFSLIKNLKSKFDGYYSNDDFAFINNPINITPFDYGFFIALRNNLEQEELITHDNLLFFPLSGGIMAQIVFKNYNLSEKETLVYVNGAINNRDVLSNKNSTELYPIKGYSDGSINIHLPLGYTFLFQNLFCQIFFHATPVLFENNTSKIFNNLSNDSKKYDEDNNYDEDYNYKKR